MLVYEYTAKYAFILVSMDVHKGKYSGQNAYTFSTSPLLITLIFPIFIFFFSHFCLILPIFALFCLFSTTLGAKKLYSSPKICYSLVIHSPVQGGVDKHPPRIFFLDKCTSHIIVQLNWSSAQSLKSGSRAPKQQSGSECSNTTCSSEWYSSTDLQWIGSSTDRQRIRSSTDG